MDTDNLKAFVMVANKRSFSDAAEALYLTQPAVSKRIAALEHSLGHLLFDRVGRQTLLTEAGLALLPKAQRILSTMVEAQQILEDLSGHISGTLKVATSHHIGLHRLPPILRQYAQVYPDVDLQFEFLDSEKAHERVAAGECDLGVVTLSPTIQEPLLAEVIWTDTLCFVVSPGHPLLQYQAVSLQQISEWPAILPDMHTFTGRLIKDCFDSRGVEIDINMTTNYLETIKMMVSVGLGWSVLPNTLIDDQIQSVEIPSISLHRQLGLISHRQRSFNNATTAFVETIRKQAKSS